MAKTNEQVQKSLEQFGEVAKTPGIGTSALVMALFDHAMVTNTELNPKASRRAIRGHWSVKVAYRDKVRNMPLAKHYEFVTSKLGDAFKGERDGNKAIDAVVAEGQLHRTRYNWLGRPDSFGQDDPQPEAGIETVL